MVYSTPKGQDPTSAVIRQISLLLRHGVFDRVSRWVGWVANLAANPFTSLLHELINTLVTRGALRTVCAGSIGHRPSPAGSEGTAST